MKATIKDNRFIILLVLFSAYIFLIGLGKMALTDPDEVFYAETAKEMLSRQEFLTPYIFSEPQFEKPPLYYWSVILSFKAFGVNEFAARFPSAIFGMLGIIGVYFLGSTLVNKRTGFLAGIILATSVGYIIMARACVTDMLLATLILYVFLFFILGMKAEYGKTKWYLLSSVCVGLAVLTKGPIGIFFPVVIVGLYLIFTKDIKRIKEVPIFPGILILLGISAPWYFLMYKAHGKEFTDIFFGFHNITRFLHPEHAWGDVVYYYVPVAAVFFAFWTVLLPLGVWQTFREKETRIVRANLFLMIWFFVIFVFFSMSRTKLPTYTAPIYPVFAIFTGRMLDIFIDKKLTQKQIGAMRICFLALFALLIGVTIGLYIEAKDEYPGIASAAIATSIIFGLFVLSSAFFLLKRAYKKSFIALILAFLFLAPVLSFVITPEIGRYEASKEISNKLLELASPDEKIGAETRYRRGVAFYTGREDVLDVHKHHILTKFLEEKDRNWCVLKEKNHRQIYENEDLPFSTPSYAVYQLGKQVIVTNKVLPGEKFLKMRP
ncbi:MAG: glycosyltransferase family 39 protein [Candidatus Omnitrophota bacterium]